MTKQKVKANNSKNNKSAQADREDDYESDLEGDMTSTLLKLVMKFTEVLTANSELNNQIKDLKDKNRNLLQRIEALENKTGEWTPQTHTHTASVSDITALANTVAEEMQARKDKELNLVIYGIQESAATTDEEMETDDKNSVCDVLNSLQVPTMNVTNVFRMGRKLSSHGHVH